MIVISCLFLFLWVVARQSVARYESLEFDYSSDTCVVQVVYQLDTNGFPPYTRSHEQDHSTKRSEAFLDREPKAELATDGWATELQIALKFGISRIPSIEEIWCSEGERYLGSRRSGFLVVCRQRNTCKFSDARQASAHFELQRRLGARALIDIISTVASSLLAYIFAPGRVSAGKE